MAIHQTHTRRSLHFISLLTFVLIVALAVFFVKQFVLKKTAKPHVKQMLNINFTEGDVPSLDSHEMCMHGRGLALGLWLFEGLTRFHPDGKVHLAGAEKVEISSCKTRYTFTLRPNYYSNERLVVAGDYEKAWKQAISPNSKCAKANLFYCIKNAVKAKKGEVPLDEVGVTALDDKTLFVQLESPTPYFLSLLAIAFFAPHQSEGETILTNGPYYIDEWKKENMLTLKANPFYWDRDRVKIKQVNISNIKDDMSALFQKEKGSLDWIGSPFNYLPSDVLRNLIASGQGDPIEIARPLWAYVNTKHVPLSSSKIRQALSAVLDRKLISQHIFAHYAPLLSPLPKNLSLSSSSIIDNQLAQGRKLFEEGLKELGLTLETFPEITLSSCSLSDFKKLTEYLQGAWSAAFGIKIRVEILEWNSFYHHLQQGRYQIGTMYIGSDYNDSLALLDPLAYSNNFSRWEDAQYHDLIEQARKEEDPLVRSALLKKAEEIVIEKMPIIPIVNETSYQLMDPALKGIVFNYRGTPDLSFAYFDDEQNENPHLPRD